MPFAKGCLTFTEFFRVAYDMATSEPYAGVFQESAKAGGREDMIKIIMDMPCIRDAQITKSYRGKNDLEGAEFYSKVREAIASDEKDEHGEESRAWILLRKALFAASADSRLFLDALLGCAKYWYDSKAFAKCLRYCECMLGLPASFYEKTAEDAIYFAERRKECAHLERECSKILKPSRNKKAHAKRSSASTNKASPRKSAVAMPTVDGKRHAAFESCSDAVDLRYDQKCGRHLVASRNIKAGSVLIVDQPFSFTMSHESLDRNCMHCQTTLQSTDTVRIPCRHCQTVTFCSEKCRREAWQTYHRYECSIFNFFYEQDSQQLREQAPHLLLAYRTTVTGAFPVEDNADEFQAKFINADFLRYHTANTDKDNSLLGKSEEYSPRDYRTVVNLETHSANQEPSINLIRTIEAIFLAKCFTFVLSKADVLCSKETFIILAVAMLHHLQVINCNAYEIVENVLDEMTHIWEPRYVGGAIYPTVSFVNHSCYPNVVRHSYPGGTVVVRTIRFIGKGDEILDCYGPHFVSDKRLTRREYLWKKYRFLCACEACAGKWQHPLPETINYKCRACSEVIGEAVTSNNKKDTEKIWTKHCPRCKTKVDTRKLNNQFRESIEKRLKANAMMYQGNYQDALPLLLEHNYFIEKFLAVPNIENIKTQQCIIQCYNQFGCTSQ